MTFWQNKKILITGHTGFKGSWLSLWLQMLDAQVIGFSLHPPTVPNLFTLADVAENMISIIGDIRDFNQIQNTIQKHKPEIIIHMAAQSLVRNSYREPIETYTTNVIGTVNLFEAARQAGCIKTMINVTSDKCYENKEWHWGYRENDRLGGYDPYSNSKACSELVTSAYRNSYFNAMNVGIATARAGNVIGGGDFSEDRLIPDIFRACINQGSLSIRYPNALRPWQYVLEPLRGYLLLAQNLYEFPLLHAESWNFGPNEDEIKPVSWIVEKVIHGLDSKIKWVKNEGPHLHEATFLKLECSKAKSKLNWFPLWNLEKGLQETVNWYHAYKEQKNMRKITLEQIKKFIH